jgi:hypothetical protein
MEEVLVDVYCPATAKSYEFLVPKTMNAKNCLKGMAEGIMGFESNSELFDLEEDVFLYDYDSRSVVNEGHTITEAGIKSGAKLMIL